MSRRNEYPYNQGYKGILQHSSMTNESFITLPAPCSNIRLTPARLSDLDAVLPIMNSLDVAMGFRGLPFPCAREQCEAWLREHVRDYENTVIHIRNMDGDVGYIDIFPLRYIREVATDGTEIFLCDVGLDREDAFEDTDDAEAKRTRDKGQGTRRMLVCPLGTLTSYGHLAVSNGILWTSNLP
ncbi:hypothetical protein B0J17DRAFT_673843 [Rhizoctonia solani]|nr:hypothetical protein B0J17DRAFT_673843 [Rhizoctonia solani]